MKRLTMKDENGYYLKDKSATITWNSLIGENRYRGEAIDRLAAIEDILCDGENEYDLDRLRVLCNQRMTMRDELSQRFSLTAKIPLDRLRELVELYSNVPHICDYCIGCEIEPTDGHGCDGYDNFVFSVRRIVAALKAREQND